jgi:hypothetical protein
VLWKLTDVSEKPTGSSFRTEEQGLKWRLRVPPRDLDFLWTMRHYNPKERHFRKHCCENLNWFTVNTSFQVLPSACLHCICVFFCMFVPR